MRPTRNNLAAYFRIVMRGQIDLERSLKLLSERCKKIQKENWQSALKSLNFSYFLLILHFFIHHLFCHPLFMTKSFQIHSIIIVFNFLIFNLFHSSWGVHFRSQMFFCWFCSNRILPCRFGQCFHIQGDSRGKVHIFRRAFQKFSNRIVWAIFIFHHHNLVIHKLEIMHCTIS